MTDREFARRHIGPRPDEVRQMLELLGYSSLDRFIEAVVPEKLRTKKRLPIEPQSEFEAARTLRRIAAKNRVYRNFIGAGYYGCITPPVIQRNILENPGWYTHYTPYQAEIAQGRLEALFTFQTVVTELTGLPVANASLLDEATAAAEAMALSKARAKEGARVFFVSEDCHPQTIEVLKTRAEALDVSVEVGRHEAFRFSEATFGALVQYPASDGRIHDYAAFIERAHAAGALVTMATDLLALCLLRSPGELGADVAVGSSQRFGVPMGFGGPHAAFFSVRDELKRSMPGRLVGKSIDAAGRPALRLALQTREQHIRREKATSNICTAQVLLAVMAGMYAVYHGPEGLRGIASRVRCLALGLRKKLEAEGVAVGGSEIFDTLALQGDAAAIRSRAEKRRMNLRFFADGRIGISVDETTTRADLEDLVWAVTGKAVAVTEEDLQVAAAQPLPLQRMGAYLQQSVFRKYHSETEFLRYVRALEARDLSLTFSMIPLGSCTMKLNAASEMYPISWPEFASLHPFAPAEQTRGYQELAKQLELYLKGVTGFSAVTFQPNSGAQGEYTGLLIVRAYLASVGQPHRRICLIPRSAHGTNPASAVMAGFQVVVVECDSRGNIDLSDLRGKLDAHGPELAALMMTYPSTHGVFEDSVQKICRMVHQSGGQVYMDGANLNALVGLCRPNELGADLCHINLHKTFCIPHGGGGPGMGPVAVKKHLAPFLPTHIGDPAPHSGVLGAVSAAPYGSAGILPIPWMYISCMGGEALTRATKIAVLNANYIAKRLEGSFPVLYRGNSGFVAHECILDLRPLELSSGIKVEDVAKRLMDFGFHAPTVSWPVPGTIMVEPTESESKEELDRFCEAMRAIRAEIQAIEDGRLDRENNPLKNAPHTALAIACGEWTHPYSREQAAFPAPWTHERKFWPAVGRIDNAYGDRNLVCTCPSIEGV